MCKKCKKPSSLQGTIQSPKWRDTWAHEMGTCICYLHFLRLKNLYMASKAAMIVRITKFS